MPSGDVTIVDGSLDFSGGVNSYAVTTVQSDRNPNGLKRNQVSWMDNCTVRGGGITQRTGWLKLGPLPEGATGLYQGKFMYEPDNALPYLVYSIGGQIWMADPDNPALATNLSAIFPGTSNPPDAERAYFCQAEKFLIIQAGDFFTAAPDTPLNVAGYAVYDGDHTFAGTSIPPVGGSWSCLLSTPYLGSVGDILIMPATMTRIGVNVTSWANPQATYQVTNIAGATVTLTVVTNNLGTAPTAILTGAFPFIHVVNPTTINQSHKTLPLFWDGTTLRRSKGINTLTIAPGTPGVNEIPAATSMDYYMGRLWYAQDRNYSAGDIVGGASGTLANQFRDAVLNVTENPLCVGGDGFTVPTNAGTIRAIKHSANINVSLGQGQLYIFTRKQIYSLNVPVNRSDWISATAEKQPLQVVAQIVNGSVNDRSVVHVNGDLFFQSLEPSIRSLTISVRNFQQWGNVPISINELRILQFNDRGLLRFGSGIEFDNRMIQTALPYECPVGVAHKALVPLNFDVVSTLDSQLPPVWEGMYEGMPILELATGDFGGRQRAFATVWSELHNNIQIWEITNSSRFEDLDNRVTWYIEFPAFTWGDEFKLKKLVSAELWIDKIFGEVDYIMEYRPDGDPCWYPWHIWQLCTARNQCEDVHNPICVYPRTLRESFRQTITLPNPPNVCQSTSGRPTNIGYQFQCRLTIKGWCRIRGLLLKAEEVEATLYGDLTC